MEKEGREAKMTLENVIKHKILQIQIEQEIRGKELSAKQEDRTTCRVKTEMEHCEDLV